MIFLLFPFHFFNVLSSNNQSFTILKVKNLSSFLLSFGNHVLLKIGYNFSLEICWEFDKTLRNVSVRVDFSAVYCWASLFIWNKKPSCQNNTGSNRISLFWKLGMIKTIHWTIHNSSLIIFNELHSKNQVSWRKHCYSLQQSISYKSVLTMLWYNVPILDLVIIILPLLYNQNLRYYLIWSKWEIYNTLNLDYIPLWVSCVNCSVFDVLKILPAICIDHINKIRKLRP